MSTRTTGKSGGARTQSRSGSGARQAGQKPKRSGSAGMGTAGRQRATPRDGAAARQAAPSKKAAAQPRDPNVTEDGKWRLRLYVAGQTPKSLTAFANLKRLCEQYLPGQYHIEVIDLVENPQLAQGDQIVAVPTLVRRLPQPLKRVIGDLSNTERALIGLELRPGS